MKKNAKFYQKIIAMIGIALLVAGITRTSRADDGRDFATKSKFTKIDIPGAVFGTQAAGINLQDDIVGYYKDNKDNNINYHGFLLSKGKVTTIDVPGSVNGTQAAGINLQGDIVGSYFDSGFNGHGFLLSKGRFTDIPPGTTGGSAQGINDARDIVGFYSDSSGNGHGFLLSTTIHKYDDVF
jgi:uncharacterized membrane protein